MSLALGAAALVLWGASVASTAVIAWHRGHSAGRRAEQVRAEMERVLADTAAEHVAKRAGCVWLPDYQWRYEEPCT
jgi:hypothetical protein